MTFKPALKMIEAHVADAPDAIAMRQKRYGIWQEYTWSDVQNIAFNIGSALIGLGVKPDTKIGILSENRREWVLAQLGIQAAGGVVAGMYATSPAVEIEHFVTASDCEVLFIEDQEQFDKILELDGKIPRLRKLVVFEPKGLAKETHLDLQSFDDFVAQGAAALKDTEVQSRINETKADDTALMVFTSGSTGLPKAAEITHGNYFAASSLVNWLFSDIPADANVLSYLPLNHIAEQEMTVINSLASRRTMNFGESLRTITIDLRDVAPEIFFGVPRIWEKMRAGVEVQTKTAGPIRRWLIEKGLKSAETRNRTPLNRWSAGQMAQHQFWDLLVYRHIRSYLGLGRCQIALSAAAPISVELLYFFRGIGVNIREVWGMSETTGAVTAQPDWGDSQGRVGQFPDHIDWKIADDGELLVKGDVVFKGYYGNPAATAETIVDGWLHTGDVAETAPDGSISIVDRKKDIIINAAGKNLSPSHIENTMKASPFIKECIVIGDKRPYVTALIQIDFETVRVWAEAQGITYTTFRSLAETDEVVNLINVEVERQNGELARVEQVKKVSLLTKELDHDDGEVTATMKVRRAAVAKTYATQIEALYV